MLSFSFCTDFGLYRALKWPYSRALLPHGRLRIRKAAQSILAYKGVP